MENVFTLSNVLVMPFWLLMIFLPNWQWTRGILRSPWVLVPPALLYTLLIISSLGSLPGTLLSPTLDGIQSLLASPQGATIAWAHFLAFDFFVGRWEYLDNETVRLPALIMAPILFFTLMLGPFGLLLYLAAKAIKLRRKASGSDVPGNSMV